MQGHVVDVHAVAHPQTCNNCDKEFFSVDSLQGHVADVHENGEPMYELKRVEKIFQQLLVMP